MRPDPIFILGAHKSGTTLLRNLFGGHQDLFAVPFESHFFQWMDRNVDYEYRKNRNKGLSIEEIEKNFHAWIETSNNAVDPMGDTLVKDKLNMQVFKDNFSISPSDTDKRIFEKYMEAIHLSLGFGVLTDEKRVVEKSVENAEFAIELSKMFPQAKFIHIVRNPYSNFVSLRKYKSVGFGYPLLKRMVKTFRNSYRHLEENPKQIADYRIIRYEDLLTDPEKIMRQLSEFLGIEFTQNLLTPTHLGQPWSGNSTSGNSFTGISADGMDKWKDQIASVEIHCVNRNSKKIIEGFGYDWIDTTGSIFSRCVGESLTRYVYNRLTVV